MKSSVKADVHGVRKWLSRGWNIECEIESLQKCRERAEARAYGRLRQGHNASIGCGSSRRDGLLVTIAEYGARLDRRKKRLLSVLDEIHDAVEQVEDSKLRVLLLNRYVLLMAWQDVATALSYDYDHVRGRLHIKALEAASGTASYKAYCNKIKKKKKLPQNTTSKCGIV